MGAGTEMVTVRWGMPSSPRAGDPPQTRRRRNGANSSSRRSRCLVPASVFRPSTRQSRTQRPRPRIWCGSPEGRPPAIRIRGQLRRVRGRSGYQIQADRGGPHLGFLDGIVEPIHPIAMTVILTTESKRGIWTRAPWDAAAHQSGGPNGGLIAGTTPNCFPAPRSRNVFRGRFGRTNATG